MKAATVRELKLELSNRSSTELLEFCLRLSKFKIENKELLTYLLYESADEATYIHNIKREIAQQFEEINTSSYYFIKKSTRKILRNTNKFIRYSKKKETAVELLLCFCFELQKIRPSIENNVTLVNLYNRQVMVIKKILPSLHDDLKYDYETSLNTMVKFET